MWIKGHTFVTNTVDRTPVNNHYSPPWQKHKIKPNPNWDIVLHNNQPPKLPQSCEIHRKCAGRSPLWRARHVLVPGLVGCLLSLAMFAALSLEEPVLAKSKNAALSAKRDNAQFSQQKKLARAALRAARAAKKKWRPPLPPLEMRQRIYWPRVRDYADQNDLDPLLVMAVIQVESTFNPYALSKRGAAGLMQIVPGTAEHLGLTDPFDADANVEAGTRYLKWLFKVFKGDERLALAAYNAGPTKVLNKGRVPRLKETLRYIRRVMQHKDRFRSRFASLAQN